MKVLTVSLLFLKLLKLRETGMVNPIAEYLMGLIEADDSCAVMITPNLMGVVVDDKTCVIQFHDVGVFP